MNNRNWVAVFLGLAVLVLFVSVMGASGNWLNNNNDTNNGATPQQINQTVRGMNETPNDGNLPTEIDANKISDDVTDATKNTANNVTDATKNIADDFMMTNNNTNNKNNVQANQ